MDEFRFEGKEGDRWASRSAEQSPLATERASAEDAKLEFSVILDSLLLLFRFLA